MRRLSVKIVFALVLISLTINGAAFSEGTSNKEVKPGVVKKAPTDIIFPDWSSLSFYKLDGLEFNKSREADLKKVYPFINDVEEPDANIRIYSFSPKQKPNYLSVKIAFEDGLLSWIDFLPAETITVDDFTKVLGSPFYVNKRVSDYLDYYDYGDILVLVDKKKGTVYSFSKYSSGNYVSNNAKKVGFELLPLKYLINGKLGSLVPGVTKENEIKKLYPALKPSVLNADYYPGIDLDQNEDQDAPIVYIINKGFEGTRYDRIELVVKNGILKWIDIIPKKLLLKDALTYFGNKYKKDEGNYRVEFFVFNNLILTVSKKDHTVLNIGIVGKYNNKLKQALPSWKDLNKKGIAGIEVDKTTLSQFKMVFPGLVSEDSKEGNLTILKVSEGLFLSGYDVVYFIFKNNKLSSVDLVPVSNLKISDLITVYGNNYEIDKESSDDVDYYSFDNVIVSVNKDDKMVNSIGLY